MSPLLLQDLARQQRESLERDVIHHAPLALTYGSGYWNDPREDKGFLFPLFARSGALHGHPGFRTQIRSAAFGRRLTLSLFLLCILMPLFGMAIGISLPILILGSLLCLLVILLSIVSGRI
ncbi:MAG TPA: hypothetical protein VFA09_10860 [Ktedonobacteraceae bacterium]|nr:hypothetical protein [Ktedonobacteraceae bacterium]